MDFLIHVRGLSFLDTVNTLLDGRAAPIFPSQPVYPKVRKPFALPKANRCGFHAVEYLQKRGIDDDIITRCIKENRFYESVHYHNCVFVGYDVSDTPRFACVRAVVGGFRQDIEGSDKRYGFVLPSTIPNSRYLAVSESPIDALSLASLLKMESSAWEGCSYLSLGGVSPLALLQYLKDHPGIDRVYLCLDNDKAGYEATPKIENAILADDDLAKRGITIVAEPPSIGKDYNEALLIKLDEKIEQEAMRRQRAAICM